MTAPTAAETALSEPTHYTTTRGERVNAYSDLCSDCSDSVAQIAVFWTDDAEFADAAAPPVADRFALIQRHATDRRRECREHCGRIEVAPAGVRDENTGPGIPAR